MPGLPALGWTRPGEPGCVVARHVRGASPGRGVRSAMDGHLRGRDPRPAERERGRGGDVVVGERVDEVLVSPKTEPWHPDLVSQAWRRDVQRAIDDGVVPFRMTLHDGRHWYG